MSHVLTGAMLVCIRHEIWITNDNMLFRLFRYRSISILGLSYSDSASFREKKWRFLTWSNRTTVTESRIELCGFGSVFPQYVNRQSFLVNLQHLKSAPISVSQHCKAWGSKPSKMETCELYLPMFSYRLWVDQLVKWAQTLGSEREVSADVWDLATSNRH